MYIHVHIHDMYIYIHVFKILKMKLQFIDILFYLFNIIYYGKGLCIFWNVLLIKEENEFNETSLKNHMFVL